MWAVVGHDETTAPAVDWLTPGRCAENLEQTSTPHPPLPPRHQHTQNRPLKLHQTQTRALAYSKLRW